MVDFESGVSEMKIKSSNEIVRWEPFKQYYSLPLTQDGKYKKTGCFRDYANNQTCESFTLIKDTVPPQPAAFTVKEVNKYHKVNDPAITLLFSNLTTDIAFIEVSNNLSLNASYNIKATDTINWFLIPGDGEKTIYVKFIDEPGDDTSPYSYTTAVSNFQISMYFCKMWWIFLFPSSFF